MSDLQRGLERKNRPRHTVKRLVPEHFKVDGTPKTGYPNQQAATESRGNARDGIYQCSFCGLWHRTHKPSKSSRRKYPKAAI